jgi:PTS system nitrogen regulatory IIA component
MPVDLVFGLLSPELAGVVHLHALAAISRMMRDDKMHTALSEAPGDEAMYALIANAIDRGGAGVTARVFHVKPLRHECAPRGWRCRR